METKPLPIIDTEPSKHEGQHHLKQNLDESLDSTSASSDTNTRNSASTSNSHKASVQPVSENNRYYTFTDPEHGDATWRPGSYAGIGARNRTTHQASEVQPSTPANTTVATSSTNEPHVAPQSPTSSSKVSQKSSEPQKADFSSDSSYIHAETIDSNPSKTQPQKNGHIEGITQMAIGAAIAAIGVPLLVLPGPGLLVLGSGLALAAHGAKRTFTKPQQTPPIG